MKLGAYKINNTPVSNLATVEEASLNGNKPFIIVDNIPAGYQDITSIENMHTYGTALIGTTIGFKDWKCLQREIKVLVFDAVDNDLDANWNNLNNNEKLIACQYMLSKIPVSKLAATLPDPAVRMSYAIEFDLNNRRARGSWLNGTGRTEIMRIYLFSKIGSENALLVFHEAVRDGLIELYEGGVEGTEEDGNIGIIDFILSRVGYSEDGLSTRNYPVIDGSGDTMEDVAEALANIALNGIY
jgi:hypothetical protein